VCVIFSTGSVSGVLLLVVFHIRVSCDYYDDDYCYQGPAGLVFCGTVTVTSGLENLGLQSRTVTPGLVVCDILILYLRTM